MIKIIIITIITTRNRFPNIRFLKDFMDSADLYNVNPNYLGAAVIIIIVIFIVVLLLLLVFYQLYLYVIIISVIHVT